MLRYTARLTRGVASVCEADVQAMGEEGCADREILEVKHVVAYFNYSNRVLNGLGVTTDGDVVGYYQ